MAEIAKFLEDTQTVEETERTKGQLIRDFVVQKFIYAREGMLPFQEEWKQHYLNYKGTRSDTKELWQANYTTSTLKEIVRVKVPLYMNILFSRGIDSFDMKPGEMTDEEKIPYVKDVLKYQCRNIGKDIGGFFGTWGNYCKQFEMYGYSAGLCYWKKERNHAGEITFDGPDFRALDIFHFYPDPSAIGLRSWKIIQDVDVYLSYLRMQEDLKQYKNVEKLRNVNQPDDEFITVEDGGMTRELDPRVELLTYYGEIPEALLDGDLDDIYDVDEYTDKYVDAVITLGNREVVLRAKKNPYKCGNTFIESSKDRMLTERFGIGTGEDIEAMAEELTNAHNKLSDAVNIICNPMGIINPNFMSGLSTTLLVHPGKMFIANSMVDDVRKALQFIDTTAAASALTPLMNFISLLDNRLMKLSQAVPAISPTSEAGEMHETLGGTQIQQANAAEPIKHIVKHELEPAWEQLLSIFYKLDIQLFPDSMAYKVLGKEGIEAWNKISKEPKMKKEDIALAGDPDFIPRGVTVFSEKQVELRNLLEFLTILIKSMVPVTKDGQQVPGVDGKPQMEPAGDVAEAIKRIALLMNFDDIDLLLPNLKELREKQQSSKKINQMRKQQEEEIRAQLGTPTPGMTGGTPPVQPVGLLNARNPQNEGVAGRVQASDIPNFVKQ
jgi:hypothetical protein